MRGTVKNGTRSQARMDRNHRRLKTGESQRSNGTYMYRWTDENGRRRTAYARTLEELRNTEDEITRNRMDGIRTYAYGMTVNDVYQMWKKLKRGIKDSTMQNYIYMYEMFVMPTFGKSPLIKVRKSDVKRFYNGLIERRVMSVATLDGIHNILHQVFQVAVDDEIIRGNPADGMLKELKQVYRRPEKKDALTREQEKLFFDFLDSRQKYRHWRDIFFIMANTGMRVGELTGLTWDDVKFSDDRKSGTVSVNHTLVYYNHRNDKGCYYSINTPKTKAGCREIPMTEAVCRAFISVKQLYEECEMECESHIDGYSDFVFINRFGQVYNEQSINRAIKKVTRECNMEILKNTADGEEAVLVPDFSAHILRHTFATRLAESGKISPKTLQILLGHTDISTTFNIYVTLSDSKKREEMEAYEEFRNGFGKTEDG